VLVEPASINSGAADKVSRDAAAAMAAASPQGRARYQGAFTAMLEVMSKREAQGSPPGVAAASILRALTASRPRAVYLTGRNSRRLAALSKLPAPVLDAARRHVFGLPAPGSLAGR
jgi:hypothetical protein